MKKLFIQNSVVSIISQYYFAFLYLHYYKVFVFYSTKAIFYFIIFISYHITSTYTIFSVLVFKPVFYEKCFVAQIELQPTERLLGRFGRLIQRPFQSPQEMSQFWCQLWIMSAQHTSHTDIKSYTSNAFCDLRRGIHSHKGLGVPGLVPPLVPIPPPYPPSFVHPISIQNRRPICVAQDVCLTSSISSITCIRLTLGSRGQRSAECRY